MGNGLFMERRPIEDDIPAGIGQTGRHVDDEFISVQQERLHAEPLRLAVDTVHGACNMI
jgi:hypothetical protein